MHNFAENEELLLTYNQMRRTSDFATLKKQEHRDHMCMLRALNMCLSGQFVAILVP